MVEYVCVCVCVLNCLIIYKRKQIHFIKSFCNRPLQTYLNYMCVCVSDKKVENWVETEGEGWCPVFLRLWKIIFLFHRYRVKVTSSTCYAWKTKVIHFRFILSTHTHISLTLHTHSTSKLRNCNIKWPSNFMKNVLGNIRNEKRKKNCEASGDQETNVRNTETCPNSPRHFNPTKLAILYHKQKCTKHPLPPLTYMNQ